MNEFPSYTVIQLKSSTSLFLVNAFIVDIVS